MSTGPGHGAEAPTSVRLSGPRAHAAARQGVPGLLDRVRRAIRARHYSPRTERAYVGWIERFIRFHRMRHPAEMGEREITRFLSWLATERRVSASTQNQALSALLFLYRAVLGLELEWMSTVVRAKRHSRLPVVLSRPEVTALLAQLQGLPWLLASLLYGTGLRLSECVRLRVKDVDFERNEIVVRGGKGQKDRKTLLPASLKPHLVAHLRRVRRQHAQDLREGRGAVELPHAIDRKYPGAAREWAWQWVFPATRFYTDRESGQRRRHHLHGSVLQRAVRRAVQEA